MKCGECGSENIKRESAKGRRFGYMKWDDLELKVDVDLLTCQDCSNILLAPGDAEALDKGLKQSLEYPDKEAEKTKIRFQVVRNGSGYQVRVKRFFGWKWITDMNRRGKQVIAYYQNVDDALKAGLEYVQFQAKIEAKKTKKMVVVYDSHKFIGVCNEQG